MPDSYDNTVVAEVDGFQYTCGGYESAARFVDGTAPECESYYRLIGHVKCGCPVISTSDEEKCTLCAGGLEPSDKTQVVDLKLGGQWEAGGITCNDMNGFLSSFAASERTCETYRAVGEKDCGCPDATKAPTKAPTDGTTDDNTNGTPTPTPAPDRTRNGATIGVGVGGTFIILLLGLFLRKKKKSVKKDVEIHGEDDIQFRPDREILPKIQVRSDQEGVEIYSQDYFADETVEDENDSGNVVLQQSNNNSLFRDSDSSDSEIPTDEENESKPIAFRKNASYRVENTMEL